MNSRFVRVALLLYPSRWRRRYGDELEQLLLDSAGPTSSRESVRLIVDVAVSGLAQRLQRYGTGARVIVVVCLCAASGVLVDVSTAARSGRPSVAPVQIGNVLLAPNVFLGRNVSVVPWHQEPTLGTRTNRHAIYVDVSDEELRSQPNLRVMAFTGAPTAVVLDPRSDRVTAVEPADHDPKSVAVERADDQTNATTVPTTPQPKPGLYRLP
jgi:hypothetical protein